MNFIWDLLIFSLGVLCVIAVLLIAFSVFVARVCCEWMHVFNAHDQAAIDRLMAPPAPPERIFGWLDSHLSIARHYGGIQAHGNRYVVDYDAGGNPLVRHDIFAAEHKAKRDANRAEARAKAAKAKMDQWVMF